MWENIGDWFTGLESWLDGWGTLLAVCVSAAATVGILGAAIVQARSASRVAMLTGDLVKTTEQYAKDTQRMADSLAEERAQRNWELSRTVAQEVQRVTVEALMHVDTSARNQFGDVERAHAKLKEAYPVYGAQLADGELRDRINTVAHIAYTAYKMPADDRNRLYGKQRVWDALNRVRESLEHFIRRDPLPERALPHYQRVFDWLSAPNDARVEDYQSDNNERYSALSLPSLDGDGNWYLTLNRRSPGPEVLVCRISSRGTETIAETNPFSQEGYKITVIHPQNFNTQDILPAGTYDATWFAYVGNPPGRELKPVVEDVFEVP